MSNLTIKTAVLFVVVAVGGLVAFPSPVAAQEECTNCVVEPGPAPPEVVVPAPEPAAGPPADIPQEARDLNPWY